jgi:hypothetical protein
MSANATAPGWLLLFGFGLLALGLFSEPAEPRQGGGQEPPVVDPGGGLTVSPPAAYGTADSNDQMIAVTGIDVTGSSILYVIDTQHRQLAVYQANSGSASTMGLRFVAGRNIDLDLQVWGYNDKSEHSYRQMVEQFEKKNK